MNLLNKDLYTNLKEIDKTNVFSNNIQLVAHTESVVKNLWVNVYKDVKYVTTAHKGTYDTTKEVEVLYLVIAIGNKSVCYTGDTDEIRKVYSHIAFNFHEFEKETNAPAKEKPFVDKQLTKGKCLKNGILEEYLNQYQHLPHYYSNKLNTVSMQDKGTYKGHLHHINRILYMHSRSNYQMSVSAFGIGNHQYIVYCEQYEFICDETLMEILYQRLGQSMKKVYNK